MTEIEIIKELFVASSNKSVITVLLSDNSRRRGHVAKFDGNEIDLDGEAIPVSTIVSIEKTASESSLKTDDVSKIAIDANKQKSTYVQIYLTENGIDEVLEGFLFDYKENKLMLMV